MSDILCMYFSRTGNTRTAMQELAGELDAELVELTMSIHAKKQQAEEQKRKFGVLDERYMKRAEDMLFGELAVALNIERSAVPGYIAERLKRLSADR